MNKYGLMKLNDSVIRIIDIKADKLLITDCIKRTMPVWVTISDIKEYRECSVTELQDIQPVETLNTEQKKIMHERFTMITPILANIGNKQKRSELIRDIAEDNGITKQTVRKYLCAYLAYMDIIALAPKERVYDEELTQDEKNIRWALNKFYYTTQKHSLQTAYTCMLKEKYCDKNGKILDKYPSFYQFRYFYRKNRSLQNYYISRNGITDYQRNDRPLVGDGIREFASNIGVGMLDSTVCDIYLVNETGDLVGRPILTACIDAYSSLCCGFVLSWEGGVYSLRGLMLSIIEDKVDMCKRHGITIMQSEWNCSELPGTFVTDKGAEYASENFEQITELGIKIDNLPPYRPELKGSVEKFFDLIQSSFKKRLKGRGVIECDFRERGAHDYRKDACLTLKEFETIVLHCVIYYNSHRIVETFPFTDEMISADIKPHASDIWNWGKEQIGANTIKVKPSDVITVLLPRTVGRFSRYGLKANRLRYHRDGYTEQYLKGGEVTVAYDPDDVGKVWVIENGVYVEFELIESNLQGKDLVAVQQLQADRKAITRNAEHDNVQAQIDLARHIEAIAGNAGKKANINIKNVGTARRIEQVSAHINYMKGTGK